MEDARKEGGRWFCSPSCLLQGSPGKRKNTKQRTGPVRAFQGLVKWTLIALGLLIVVGILGAIAGVGKTTPKAASSTTRQGPRLPPRSSALGKGATTSGVPVPTSAQVSVVTSGFSQTGGNAGDSISYGLILRNRSTTLSAVAVKVTETFLDAHDRSVATDSQTLTGIPAGGRFEIGGDTVSNVSLQVSRFKVAVTVGGSITAQLLLPPVFNVAFVGRGFVTKVIGALRNPYKVPLPSDATVFLVYTNSTGQIVGGDSEPTGATVQSGASVSFSDNLLSITPSPTTTVTASVDPDGYPTPGSGHIRWTS